MYWFLDLLDAIWGWTEGVVERCEIWFWTRRWDESWGALPAFLATLVLALVILGQKGKPALAVAEPYRRAFRTAAEHGDLPAAELWLRKLNSLQMADAATQYLYGELAARAGRPDLAWQTMNSLAPPQQTGYPQAHFWLAAQLLRKQRQGWLDRERLECLHHLAAAKSDPDLRSQAASWLGTIHLARRDFSSASREFEDITTHTISSRVAAAVAAQLAGQVELEQKHWTAAVTACESSLAKEPDRSDLYLLLAVSQARLDRPTEAVRVLREGMRRSRVRDPRLEQALGLALLGQLGANRPQRRDAAQEQTQLIDELLELAPTSSAIALRLLQWSQNQGEAGEQLRRELVERATAGGVATPAILSAVGTAAAQAGQLAAARQSLEQAVAADPQNALTLNNLAWVLMRSDPPELDRALQLANAALARSPEHPQIRETRGQIHFRQGHWRDAIADLEAALPKLPTSTQAVVRGTLADAYLMLGQFEQAARYRPAGSP